jgi:hypothetical protein
MMEPKSCGVLDTPLSQSMTVFVLRKRTDAPVLLPQNAVYPPSITKQSAV